MKGRGIPVYDPGKGHGVFVGHGFAGSVFKTLFQFLKRSVLPTAIKTLKHTVLPTAIKSGAEYASDLIRGKKRLRRETDKEKGRKGGKKGGKKGDRGVEKEKKKGRQRRGSGRDG